MKKRRLEMGEEAWAEYQRQRKNNKANAWKSRNVERVVDWRRNAKQKLIAYKGGKCQMCGYDKDCPGAYDFHHRDPKTKSFGIGGLTIGFAKLKKEVDKCDLICRRCHAEIHDEQYIKQRNETKEKLKSRYIELQKRKTWQYEKSCLGCQQFFIPKKKRQIYCCRNCANATRQRIKN
jgi:hypothetical protein